MRVVVDEDNCSGTGLCTRICGEIFEIHDDVSHVRIDPIPEDFEARVAEAVRLCPLQALSIEGL